MPCFEGLHGRIKIVLICCFNPHSISGGHSGKGAVFYPAADAFFCVIIRAKIVSGAADFSIDSVWPESDVFWLTGAELFALYSVAF